VADLRADVSRTLPESPKTRVAQPHKGATVWLLH